MASSLTFTLFFWVYLTIRVVIWVMIVYLIYQKTFSLLANYETGVSGYKHVYFNCTLNTLIIWMMTVMAIIGKKTCLKKIGPIHTRIFNSLWNFTKFLLSHILRMECIFICFNNKTKISWNNRNTKKASSDGSSIPRITNCFAPYLLKYRFVWSYKTCFYSTYLWLCTSKNGCVIFIKHIPACLWMVGQF